MGHANTPPELPEVTDEAGDTPKWVPWLGVGLFVLAVAWIVLGHSEANSQAADAEAAQVAD
jgi:hypothetical protein